MIKIHIHMMKISPTCAAFLVQCHIDSYGQFVATDDMATVTLNITLFIKFWESHVIQLCKFYPVIEMLWFIKKLIFWHTTCTCSFYGHSINTCNSDSQHVKTVPNQPSDRFWKQQMYSHAIYYYRPNAIITVGLF